MEYAINVQEEKHLMIPTTRPGWLPPQGVSPDVFIVLTSIFCINELLLVGLHDPLDGQSVGFHELFGDVLDFNLVKIGPMA